MPRADIRPYTILTSPRGNGTRLWSHRGHGTVRTSQTCTNRDVLSSSFERLETCVFRLNRCAFTTNNARQLQLLPDTAWNTAPPHLDVRAQYSLDPDIVHCGPVTSRPKKRRLVWVWSCVCPPSYFQCYRSLLTDEQCNCGESQLNINLPDCPSCAEARCNSCPLTKR